MMKKSLLANQALPLVLAFFLVFLLNVREKHFSLGSMVAAISENTRAQEKWYTCHYFHVRSLGNVHMYNIPWVYFLVLVLFFRRGWICI